MGKFSINAITKMLPGLVASILVYLNVKLVYERSADYFSQPGNLFWKIVIVIGVAWQYALLLYVFIHPWISKKQSGKSIQLHREAGGLNELEVPAFKKIAIALDFSDRDEKLLAYAIGQGNKDSSYLLIHVVESASARMLGKQSDDFETRNDQERLDLYKTQLEQRGFHTSTRLGYQFSEPRKLCGS